MVSKPVQDNTPPNIRRYQTLLQSSLSITAIIYILGFVVSNSYYGLFGVFNYDLVQSRYLAAGISFIYFTILGSIIFGLAISLGYWLKPGNAEFFATILSVSYLAILLMYAAIAHKNNPENFLISIMSVSPFFLLVVIIGCFISWVVVGELVFNKMKEFRWVDKFIENTKKLPPLITYTVIIGYILTCASIFGKTIWGVLTPEYGGGKPYEAVFKLESEFAENNDMLFLPIGNEGITPQLKILYETDKEYVVLTATSNKQPIALRIPKDIITEVVYAPYMINSTLNPKLIQIPTIVVTPEPTYTPPPP